jgi:hypothetical protein
LIVEGCTTRASVADHILPTYPGMPDTLFFGEGNLRGGCKTHNVARGMAATLDEAPTSDASSTVVTGDYTRSDDAR